MVKVAGIQFPEFKKQSSKSKVQIETNK